MNNFDKIIQNTDSSKESVLLQKYFNAFLSDAAIQECLLKELDNVSSKASQLYQSLMKENGFEYTNIVPGNWTCSSGTDHVTETVTLHSAENLHEPPQLGHPVTDKESDSFSLSHDLQQLEDDLDKALCETAHSGSKVSVKKTDSGVELVPSSSFGIIPPLCTIGKWSSEKSQDFFGQTSRAALAIFKQGNAEPKPLSAEEMIHIALVCELPRYLSHAFSKVCLHWQQRHSDIADDKVHYSSFLTVWQQLTSKYHDSEDLCFGVLSSCANSRGRLVFESFEPLLEEVLKSHPGLDFLQGLAVFKKLYMETVITRLFYEKSNSSTNEMSLAEWRKGKYASVIRRLEHSDDINAARDVFSYKHFYVIYCKFWELDDDHDMHIERRSVHMYDGGSMLRVISDRAAAGFGRKLWSKDPNKWTYRDFIWFILSVEEKSHPSAIEYWFRCCDLDGDGVLSLYELSDIFDEQFNRMFDQSCKVDYIKHEDFLCILLDMCRPANKTYITLSDLKRCSHTEHFFNFLFDMRQYENITTRRHDPLFREWYDIVVAGQDGTLLKLEGWDRFAERAYDELASIDVNSQSSPNSGSQTSTDHRDSSDMDTEDAFPSAATLATRDEDESAACQSSFSTETDEEDDSESSTPVESSMEDDDSKEAVDTCSPARQRRRPTSISPSDERRHGISILDDLISGATPLDPGALSRSIATFIEDNATSSGKSSLSGSPTLSPQSSPLLQVTAHLAARDMESPTSLNLARPSTSAWLPQLCASINTNGMVFGRSTSPSPPRYFRPKSISPKRASKSASPSSEDSEHPQPITLNLESIDDKRQEPEYMDIEP